MSAICWGVSIPLRKVSRHVIAPVRRGRDPVSIPLRKVSRRPGTFATSGASRCFHPSKEGFKGFHRLFSTLWSIGSFHPSKEGFKEGNIIGCKSLGLVSIPLRKVSRVEENAEYTRGLQSFHPSKEGFKAWAWTRTPFSLFSFPSL